MNPDQKSKSADPAEEQIREDGIHEQELEEEDIGRPDEEKESKQRARPLVNRYFTEPGTDVRETVEWEERTAKITEADGEVLFEKKIEAPKSWSQNAVNIAAYKYLLKSGLGEDGEEQETSIWQLLTRVADTLADQGRKLGHIQSDKEYEIFRDELLYVTLHQKGAFNSPVWFNCGVHQKYGITTDTTNYFWNPETEEIEPTDAYKHPQCSACFIQSIDDSMDSILDLLKREGKIFKLGSGTGTNYSSLRAKGEPLSKGGKSSGLMSFLDVFDSNAGAIKSGGTTRRAAKMDIVDIDHPEVTDFIWWKAEEEDKAKLLIKEGGFEADFNGEAYETVSGQNSNNSVRVTDEFMEAYENDEEWETKYRLSGETADTYEARDLMNQIAEAAWHSADPGMQYDTTINDWHTCKNSGRIDGSNPCSEYMFLDDTACNLASINLLEYLGEDGNFDIEGFVHTIHLLIMAQEIIVDFAAYPSERIAQRSHDFRTLGLGYANLGALLMVLGLPYDSDEGRAIAASITSILSGQGYLMSSKLAERLDPFPRFEENREPMLDVMEMHRESAYEIDEDLVPEELWKWATKSWDKTIESGRESGYRNAQISVLAPTGTISFFMDCDTTGIEPDYSLVKWKKLAGGGGYEIVNQAVPKALDRLGYTEDQIEEIKDYTLEEGTIEGAPHVEERHLPVFDCANPAPTGERFISPMGHMKMVAAVQPFISGAISKTVNVPEDTSVEEIEELYYKAWKMGIKALALYRNNSKGSQPLSSKGDEGDESAEETKEQTEAAPETQQVKTSKNLRHITKEMPQTRKGITHKFSINNYTVYITANLFEDGTVGEIFLESSKEGSTLAGLLDTLARMMSKMLQRGVPLEVVVDALLNMQFDPSGATNNPDILFAKSIPDYIGKWLGYNFIPEERWQHIGLTPPSGGLSESIENDIEVENTAPIDEEKQQSLMQENEQVSVDLEEEDIERDSDAPSCHNCGSLMVRNGSCWACPDCGETTGCS